MTSICLLQDLLIFNRVPKVGSQTLMSLFTVLSRRNNFTAYKDDGENIRIRGETTMVMSFVKAGNTDTGRFGIQLSTCFSGF